MCITWNWVQKKGNYITIPKPHKNKKLGDEWEIANSMKCGYCEVCRLEKANDWAVRNYYERMEYNDDECWAIILNHNLPGHTSKEPKQSRELIEYEDIKKFHKRLRKAGYKFRFFISAEYGEKYGFAHYHGIYYGLKILPEELEKIDISKKTGKPIYKCEKLEKIWGIGKTRIQRLDKNIAATFYQTLYQRKPTENKKVIEKYCKLKEVKLIDDEELNKLIKMEKDKKISQKEIEEYIKDKITLKEASRIARPYLERSTSSLGLGFDSFIKNGLNTWLKCNQKIYLAGKEFNIPYSWVIKLAFDGLKEAINHLERIEKETIVKDEDYINNKKNKYNSKKSIKILERKNNTIF